MTLTDREKRTLWCQTAGIPPRLQHCSKETWEGDYPAELDQDLPGEWDTCLIMGPAGTGKSHLAVAELLRSGARPGSWKEDILGNERFPHYRGSVIQTGAIFRDVQESVERMKPPEPINLDAYFEASILAFDDLGAERLTDFTLDRVSLILRHRFNHCRRTILTTNLTPEQLVEIDPRLASRLLSGLVILRNGKDRRL